MNIFCPSFDKQTKSHSLYNINNQAHSHSKEKWSKTQKSPSKLHVWLLPHKNKTVSNFKKIDIWQITMKIKKYHPVVKI